MIEMYETPHLNAEEIECLRHTPHTLHPLSNANAEPARTILNLARWGYLDPMRKMGRDPLGGEDLMTYMLSEKGRDAISDNPLYAT